MSEEVIIKQAVDVLPDISALRNDRFIVGGQGDFLFPESLQPHSRPVNQMAGMLKTSVNGQGYGMADIPFTGPAVSQRGQTEMPAEGP